DDLLVSVAPRYAAVRVAYERVLRQRNALLRHGIRNADYERTLDVFDTQLARAGAELTRGRLRMLERLTPLVTAAYRELAGDTVVGATYDAAWLTTTDEAESALLLALGARRKAELDRGVTLAGPHRDEWRLQ